MCGESSASKGSCEVEVGRLAGTEPRSLIGRAYNADAVDYCTIFFLMIRRPPRSTLDRSSAASDVYKRQHLHLHLQVVMLVYHLRGTQV